MADWPVKRLNNKTPLMAANIPNIDSLCKKARCGRLLTVPEGMPPGSEIANMGVLGYDTRKLYQGRGVLEAASMGVDLEKSDLAMRCNLICIDNNGKIKNHSAGHISTAESHVLIDFLNKKLGDEINTFFPGVSYRHLFVLKNGINDFSCTPPHDVPGTAFKDVLIKPLNPENDKTADSLNKLILQSQKILANHPVNIKRIKNGKDPANSVWFWSPGHKPDMKTFQELYGIKGAVISAVDLIYGIGHYAGFKKIKVEGSTGLYDTNYEGKAQAAIDALKENDLVFLHIEASDEAGHEGDVDLKIKTIEYLDRRVVKYIVDKSSEVGEDVTIALLPDHPTPCATRTHTADPVPFLIYNPHNEPDGVIEYNEESVKKGHYGLLIKDEFIKRLLQIGSESWF